MTLPRAFDDLSGTSLHRFEPADLCKLRLELRKWLIETQAAKRNFLTAAQVQLAREEILVWDLIGELNAHLRTAMSAPCQRRAWQEIRSTSGLPSRTPLMIDVEFRGRMPAGELRHAVSKE